MPTDIHTQTFEDGDKLPFDGLMTDLKGIEVQVDANYEYRPKDITQHFSLIKKDIEKSGRKDIGVMCADGLDFTSVIPVIKKDGPFPEGVVDPIRERVTGIVNASDTKYPFVLLIPMLTNGNSHYELMAIEILNAEKECKVSVVDSSKADEATGRKFLDERIIPILRETGLQVKNSAVHKPMLQVHENSDVGNVHCGAYLINNAQNIVGAGLNEDTLRSQDSGQSIDEIAKRGIEFRSRQFMELVSNDLYPSAEELEMAATLGMKLDSDEFREIVSDQGGSHGVLNGDSIKEQLESRRDGMLVDSVLEEDNITAPNPQDSLNDDYDDLDIQKFIYNDLIEETILAVEKSYANSGYTVSRENISEAFSNIRNMNRDHGDPHTESDMWKAAYMSLLSEEIEDMADAAKTADSYVDIGKKFQDELKNVASKFGFKEFTMTDLDAMGLEIELLTAEKSAPATDVAEPHASQLSASRGGRG